MPLNPLVVLRMETSLTRDCDPLRRSRRPWFTEVLLLYISIFLKKVNIFLIDNFFPSAVSGLQVGEETDHRCLPGHAVPGPDWLRGRPRPEAPGLLLLHPGAVRPVPLAGGAPARPPQHCFQVRGCSASLLYMSGLPDHLGSPSICGG